MLRKGTGELVVRPDVEYPDTGRTAREKTVDHHTPAPSSSAAGFKELR
jgi:hypothetical protein